MKVNPAGSSSVALSVSPVAAAIEFDPMTLEPLVDANVVPTLVADALQRVAAARASAMVLPRSSRIFVSHFFQQLTQESMPENGQNCFP